MWIFYKHVLKYLLGEKRLAELCQSSLTPSTKKDVDHTGIRSLVVEPCYCVRLLYPATPYIPDQYSVNLICFPSQQTFKGNLHRSRFTQHPFVQWGYRLRGCCHAALYQKIWLRYSQYKMSARQYMLYNKYHFISAGLWPIRTFKQFCRVTITFSCSLSEHGIY